MKPSNTSSSRGAKLSVVIRSGIFYICQFLSVISFAPIVFALSHRSFEARYRWVLLWVRFNMWLLENVCGLHYTVQGTENIPPTNGIILSKHQSAWETIAFQDIFPAQIWVLKRELLWLPFFGWALWALKSIAIDRTAGREALKQLVSQGKDRLQRGLCVVVFPEGTRIAPGARSKYHIGGAWLAAHAKATVVPVAHNAGEFWRRNSLLKHPGTITVSIGAPIEASGMKPDQLNQQVEDWIEAEMARLDQL